ncbi:MAG: MEDS domain-containing protein, partial [Streptosporangiaceae bacterium]
MAFEHPALFYRGDTEFLAGTLPFVRHGLAQGEPVAVAVPRPHLDLLGEALGADAESVTLIDMAEAGRNPGRIIPGILATFADAHPGAHVRIIGEPIWAGRSELEYPACAQHEALINLAFADRDATILCPYDLSGLGTRAIADAEANHPVIISGHGSRISMDFDPQRVIDATNRELPAPPVDAPTCFFDRGNLASVREFTIEQSARAGLDP